MRIIHLVLLLALTTVPVVQAAEEARDYPLGPLGGQYRISGGEAYARIVSLTAGAPGATGGLQVGDFILGAFGKPFTPTGSYHYGVSQDLGFAVDRAEGSGGDLPLQVLRPGVGGMAITVNLPAAGSFSPAYPRNDSKHAGMYESAVAWLHSTTMSGNGNLGYFTGWTGLALLGHPNWNNTTGAKPYRLSINKIRDFVVNELYNGNYAPNEDLLLDGTANPNHRGGMSNWQLGQKIMFLAELWAKSPDTTPISITVGGVTSSVTLGQALQRGAEMCGNTVQWWKQPAQHSNGFSPEYARVAGMSSHGGVTGDYMHQGWYCGINMTGVYTFNGMAFSRRAGIDMNARPKDGHYFGYNLNQGDAIPASISNALPSSITLPQYGADPVRGATITDPFWYDPSVNQKFLMQLNFLARRSGWYSAGNNDDGMVGYAPEAVTAYDAGGRTPGTLLGMAMYQQDIGGLDSADLNRMESLKGYITRNYMRHQEAHAYCVGAQAYQAMCAPYLSDRQQRFFMDNWRFYFALSRTHTGGFQYFRSRSVADNYLNETHCAALNAALPYGIANGGYSLIPAYKADRLLVRFDHPDMTWPSLAARKVKVATASPVIPFQMVDGNGQVVDPANYTATWTKLSGAGAVSFGPNTTFSDQAITIYNQNHPPDAGNLPSGGYGNYRGFSFRPNDSALSTVGGPLAAPDLLLNNLLIRRSATAGAGSAAAYLKVYASATPSTATWIGDSTNTANTNGGISDANLSFNFNSLPLQAGSTYYFYFANTPGNLAPGAITWTTGRLVASNNSSHTYPSGNLINTSWASTDTAYDAVFSASLQMRTYSSAATNSDTLTFPADNTYRIQLTVTDGTHTVVEPIDVVVDTTPDEPPPPMTITAHPQPASADPGGAVTLTLATTGPSPALYQWRRNGVPIGGASTSPSLVLSNISGGAEGDYDCVYTTELGTLTSNSARITVTGTGGNIAGGLWREIYTGIGGDSVVNLISSPKFPNFADSSGPIASAASATNYSDSYGQRWTGWITPVVSGSYRFYLASDDSSELWLGTSDLPSSASRILTLSGYTGVKQWSARAPSAYIPLTAGVRYYIELRHKEGAGGDHCALAWQLSGNPVPVNGSDEIPGSVLSYRIGGIYSDIPLENIAPAFATDPLSGPKAFDGRPYTASIADSASDPNSGSVLTYSRVNGPAWLSVATDGSLTGTPETTDMGINEFTVRVTDGGGLTDDATLLIDVRDGSNNPPVFLSDPIVLDSATAMAPYSESLSGTVIDDDLPNGDILTFEKTGGPAWLSVVPDGTLFGTPAMSDSGINQFTVRVFDSQGEEDTATLTINVGATHFNYDLNGASPGSGAAAGGTWDGSAQWSSDPNGLGAAFAWVDGAIPVFSAGTDANGDYTVTNSAVRGIGGFIARSGRPLVTGGTLQTSAAQSPFDIAATALGARIDSPLTGSGGLLKTGPGTLTLGGNNSFTGDLTVAGGVLELTASGKLYNGAFNNTAVVTVNSGGIWRMPNFSYAGVGQLADYAQRRVLNGGAIEVTGNTHSSSQNFTTAAAGGTFRYTPSGQTLTLSGNANSNLPLDGSLTFETIGHITVSEAITGTGSLNKTGAANLVLQGSNTFTGPVILSAGNLIFDGVNTENGVPELILNGGTFYLGSAFAGGTATFGALSGSGAINMAYGATTGTRTVSIHQTSDTIYSGVISNASSSRFAGLAKSGNGTLTLTGASTYTGATSVDGGILRVNGSLGNTVTTVAAAGILGGSGSISGAVNVHGTLAPGNNSVGTLATGSLTLASGARMDCEISDWTGAAGIGHDTIIATSLNLTANTANPVVIRLIGASLANFSENTARFTLIQTSGGINGFSANQFVIDPSGLTLPQGTWAVEQSDNSLVLVYTDFINPDANQNGILDAWETSRFGNADAGMNGGGEDADHDGFTNLMEFALDTHPLQPGASPLTHTLSSAAGGPCLQLEVPKNPLATNLVYRVEVTGDLNGPWSSDALTAIEIIRDDAERLIARDRTPVADAARRFIRLRVTSTP